MRRRRDRVPNVVVALALLALIAVGVTAAFVKRNPFADRFQVKLAFTERTALRPGSPVRVAGVDVGKVRRVEAAPGSARATMITIEVDETGLPLHRDARFKARPRIFLEGNEFLDVQPGSPSAPELGDGDTVPASQVSSAVSVFDVLEVFRSDGRDDLRTVLREYGDALAEGGAQGYNRSIRWWKPAYRDSAIVSEATLGERDGDLRDYLRSTATVARAFDRDPVALRGLIRDLADTSQAIASEQVALAEAIGELPPLLKTGRRALASLNGSFPAVRRFARDLRPAVRSSGPALDAQLPLVRELRGAVRRSELRGLAADLRALGSCQINVIGPWQRDRVPGFFPSAGRVFEEGVKWLPGIAGESRNFDANGQYIRSQPTGTNIAYDIGAGGVLLAGQPLRGVLPPKAPQPTFHPDVPCETQERPDLNARSGPLPQGRRVDTRSPEAQARFAELVEKARPQVERMLKDAGMEDVRIADTPLRADQLDEVTGVLGR